MDTLHRDPQTTAGRSFLAGLQPRRLAPVAGLVVIVAVFSFFSSQFLTVGNLDNVLLDSSVLLIISLAATVVILTGSIDLSVGSTLAMCAYMGAMLSSRADDNWPLLVVPLVGIVCGAVNGALVAFARLPSFLVTLGTYFVYDGLANYFAGGQPVSIPFGGVADWFAGFVFGFPIVTLWALLTLALATAGFRYTRLGRYIYAVGGNEKTARLTGVPVDRVKFYSFCLSGLLAGLAGLLQITKIESASPGMGQLFLLPSIAAVVMGGTPLSGGVGGPMQSLLGVLVIGILTNGMILTAVNPFLQNVVEGVVVVVAVAVTMNRQKSTVVK
jgi:ribose transport system permease protein/putative xylitol transport system permease protein